jgi:hypothetical protein
MWVSGVLMSGMGGMWGCRGIGAIRALRWFEVR